MDNCINCNIRVKDTDEALDCDACGFWQHRACGEVVCLRAQYRQLQAGLLTLNWICKPCADQAAALRDDSFVIDLSYNAENVDVIEDSIDDNNQAVPEFIHAEHRYLETVTQRGGRKLADNHGYSYTYKRSTADGVIQWVCSVRNKQRYCKASVRQDGNVFILGNQEHCHDPEPSVFLKSEISRQVKQQALEPVNLFTHASNIVDDALLSFIPEDNPHPAAMPSSKLLKQTVNRARQTIRPTEPGPDELDFEIQEDAIPNGFFKKDVWIANKRHLLFFTQTQAEIAETSKTWYMDATFKIVKEPFKQLFSIHAFVKSGDSVKMVPLLFALMSRRKTRDYKAVIENFMQNLRSVRVKVAVADFEKGIWLAVQAQLPGIQVRGCGFHWAQAVLRKVRELGLQVSYSERGDTYKYIRKLLGLPFLPHEQIEAAFNNLKAQNQNNQIDVLLSYIETTWISNGVYSVKSWCLYRRSIRTNNDVEGWHRRINSKASGANLSFYLLITLLYKEARLVVLSMQLISEKRLKREQRTKTKSMQCRLFKLWDDYDAGLYTPSQFLKACSFLRTIV